MKKSIVIIDTALEIELNGQKWTQFISEWQQKSKNIIDKKKGKFILSDLSNNTTTRQE